MTTPVNVITQTPLPLSSTPKSRVQREMREIPCDQLFVDPRYQRDLVPEHVNEIADNWDDDVLDPLKVSDRGPEGFAVLDGQHRHAAAQLLYRKTLPCIILKGLSTAEEAYIFRESNLSSRRINPHAEFKALLFMKDPEATDINQIVKECGFILGSNPRAGSESSIIGAYTAVVTLYKSFGRDALRATLLTIAQAWPKNSIATQGDFITGVSFFLDAYKDTTTVKERLKKFQGVDPRKIKVQANFAPVSNNMLVGGKAIARILVDVYNSSKPIDSPHRIDVIQLEETFSKVRYTTKKSFRRRQRPK